jgi:predicted lipid-binding transport protein (Tim44 family)
MQAWAFHARHPNSIGRNDMKNWLLGALVVALATSTPMLSEAKRLGSGKSQGMQRSAPAQPAPQTPPPKQAAPQQTAPTPAAAPAAAGATAAAAAPAKRSWMGPIAGLAAGLGLAALMSHLGMGEAFANFLMLALLAVAAVFLIAFLMRRFGRGARQEPGLATAGASASGSPARWSPVTEPAALEPATATATQRSAFTPAAADVSVTGQPLRPLGGAGETAPTSATADQIETPQALADTPSGPKLPEGFDLPAFERVAKMIFIRLQAANDARDLDDLRQFTTPEMFAAIRLEIQERGAATQQTDVERVEAQVINYAVEDSKQIVSVRFQGMVREEAGAAAQGFDEVWHLVKPEGDAGSWAIAGIQQPQ